MQRFYLSEGPYDDNAKNLLARVTDSWFGSPAAEVAQFHTKVASAFPYVLKKGVLISAIQHYLVEGLKTMGFLMLMILTAFFNYSQHLEASLNLERKLSKPWPNLGLIL